MSATAELLAPLRRLNIGGTLFLQGKPQPVDFATARRLDANPRFKVRGLDTREAVEALAVETRPEGESLMEAIRAAEEGLDIDDASNFDREEKVSVHALSAALGYPITVQERDRALYAKPTVNSGRLETAEGKTVASAKITVPVKKAPAAQPPVVDPTIQGAISA